MNAPFLRPHGCPRGVDLVTWRQAVEDRVDQLLGMAEALIATLDRMDGDSDLEPYLATWDHRASLLDDREGGDVQDEPHDVADEGDFEWSVGRDELEADPLDIGEMDEAEWDTPGLIVGGNENVAK